MLNLDQVKLLETKVAKAVEYVERVAGENAALHQKEEELQATLESYQKRIDELEILIAQFKEEQGQIEDGILSALDKLNWFEEAMENSLKGKPATNKGAGNVNTPSAMHSAGQNAPQSVPNPAVTKPVSEGQPSAVSDGGEICFEIPEKAAVDIIDPLRGADPLVNDNPLGGASDEKKITGADNPAKDGELEIF